MESMSLVPVSLMFIVLLVCMIVSAIFVYKDAKKRSMNEVLWALVAFFVPFFVGVIIYIAVREPIKENVCPSCGALIADNADRCEKCNTLMVTTCGKCGFPVKKGWKNCPSCGNDLPENYNQPVVSYKKESGIIPIAIIIGILVIGFAIVSAVIYGVNNVSGSSMSYGGYSGMYNIKAEDFAGNETITEWIEQCPPGMVSVLMSPSSDTCIVYVKDNKYLLQDDMELNYTEHDGEYYSSDATLNIRQSEYEDKYGYDFFVYEFDIHEDIAFEVYVEGKKQDVEVSFTDKDISVDTWEVE